MMLESGNNLHDVGLFFRVSFDELKASLSDSLDWSEARELIIALDKAMADYDFTKELRDYFVKEIEKEDEVYKESERKFEELQRKLDKEERM